MKKRILKSIKEAAKEINAPGHIEFERVKGSVLLKENPDAQCDGKPVDKDAFYKRQVIKPSDGYRALKKYLKKPENREVLKNIK